MFLYDEKRIINTASVQRFGFVNDDDVRSSIVATTYHMSEPTFANGGVIAEFEKDDQVFELLYNGSGKACLQFYINLIKALERGDRVVEIKSLHPAEPD